MSSINDVINQYLGSRVDGDGYPVGAQYQCTDWVARFVKETTNLNTTGMRVSGGAKDIFQDWPNSFVRREWNTQAIANSETNFPQKGDIIAFNANMGGGYGHTAVVESANVNNFTVIEQNGGIGRGNGQGSDAIRRFTYPNYNNVLGWIRFPQMQSSPESKNETPFAVYSGPGPSTNQGLKSFEQARDEVLSKFGKPDAGFESNVEGIDTADLQALLDGNRDLVYVFGALKNTRNDFSTYRNYVLNILLDKSKGDGWKDRELTGKYDLLHRLTSSNDYGGVIELARQGIDAKEENNNLRSDLNNSVAKIQKLETDLELAKKSGPRGVVGFAVAKSEGAAQSKSTFSQMGATTPQDNIVQTENEPNQVQQYVMPNSSNKPFYKSKKWWVNVLNLAVGLAITIFQTSGIKSGDDYQSVIAKLITAAASIIGLSAASSVYLFGQSKVDTENVKLQSKIWDDTHGTDQSY